MTDRQYIRAIKKTVKGTTPRSHWDKGVKIYALELTEEL